MFHTHTHASRTDLIFYTPCSCQVYVLRGGFGQWQARYKNDPEMIENYRPELWDAEFDNTGGTADDITY